MDISKYKLTNASKIILFLMAFLLTTSGFVYGASAYWFSQESKNNQPVFSDEVRQFIDYDEDHIIITNATLIDGTGAPAKANMSVIIKDGFITAVGRDEAVSKPSGATEIDLAGKTLVPGLVMLHEHLFYNASDPDRFIQSTQPVIFPRLYFAAGVTTARTAGSFEPYTDVKVKQAISNGQLIGPDLDTTAPFVEGAPALFLQAPEIETEQEARQFVSYWAGQGMTSFKAYTNVKGSVLKTTIDEAHKRGLKVAGHLCSVTYEDASNMGIDNLEHGFLLAPDFLKNKKEDECSGFPLGRFLEVDVNSPKAKALMKTLIKNKTAVTSTLAVLARISATLNPPNPAALEALGHGAKAHYLGNHANGYNRALTNDLWERAIKQEMAWEKAFVEEGGLLVAGSDTTGIGGTVAGFANHEQIELLVQAGFSSVEAIKIVTLNGAFSMGREKNIGSIAVGKKADLIIIDGDLDADIKNIRKVETVFKNGIGYNSQRLINSSKGRVEN